MTTIPAQRASAQRAIRAWLFSVAALIALMVLVGGATRLTESGLSIVEWKPVTGVLPPLGERNGSRRSKPTRPFRNTERRTPA